MARHKGTLTLLAILTCGSGCAYFAPTPRLKAAQGEVVVASDLPVPEGFRIDKSSSWRHERNEFRRYQLVFRRNEYLSEERVREFFKKAYPEAGWVLAFLYGLDETRMVFTKGSEECLVHIAEDFGDRYTEIRVEVKPRLTPDGEFVARRDTNRAETSPKTINASHKKSK